MEAFNRRDFLKKSAATGIGLGMFGYAGQAFAAPGQAAEKKVGIIGLDTSHSVAFAKLLNDAAKEADLAGYKVVAAYPYGSKEIESSASRIPGYTEEIKKLGVEVVGSVQELLSKTDVILLETNDGRLHLEQAMAVFEAGKPVFIDKPVAASLKDCLLIYKAAKEYKVPVFSSSSLRYIKNAAAIREGKLIGKVLGADTYSPAHLEPHHPDLFWYGIHGVETLFAVMGTGCKEVTRVHSDNTDVVTGIWNDNRVGTFRGMRFDKMGYGGTAYGETGTAPIGPYEGYRPLLVEIISFFKTGKSPVSAEETLEIYAFMEAADESKRRGGQKVMLQEVMEKARG